MNEIAEAIQESADATTRQAEATENLVELSKLKFTWLYRALSGLVLILVLGLTGLYLYAQKRADDSERLAHQSIATSQLALSQSECSWKVQGHYISQIGLLADSNGKQLRGEPPDPAGNLARVLDLRKASAYVELIDRICFTDTPDPTPIDGVLPDGTVVVPG